jgi:site-specific DNA recombinase
VEGNVSLRRLAWGLSAQGTPTPSGHWRWNQATLRGLLSNPAYTGQVYIGRSRRRPARVRRSATRPLGHPHPGHCMTPPEEWVPVASIPAVVSREQFDQVQAKLARNQAFARRHNTAHSYLLRALVSCGVCQIACMGRARSPAYRYCVCRGKAHPVTSGRDEKCPARLIPAGQLDDLVWQDLCELLTHPGSIAQAMARAQGGQWLPQALQARRENLRRGHISLEQQLERLTEAYLSSVIPLPEYQRRRRELEHKAQALEVEATRLDAEVDHQAELAGWVRSVESFCERVRTGLAQATCEQKRQLVERLIDRVVVTDAEVEIRYVIPLSPESEPIRFCHLRKDYFDTPSWAV